MANDPPAEKIEWGARFGKPNVTTATPEPGVELKVTVVGKRGKRAAHVRITVHDDVVYSDYTQPSTDPGNTGRMAAGVQYRKWVAGGRRR